jgi:putative FmdB family regulatory protein
MPVYEYEHIDEACDLGEIFEVQQSIHDPKFAECPKCGGKVKRLISLVSIAVPQSDSDLKSKGFTKLVRRDSGVYENVTATDKESRYFEAGKPETMPKLKKKK